MPEELTWYETDRDALRPKLGIETEMDELDERLLVAMRVARQHHLTIWDNALREHKSHPTFKMQGYPHTLEYAFTCECEGVEREWRIRVHALKEMLPEARDAVMRLYKHSSKAGQKALRRMWAKADRRARALLYRYLSREQRMEVRRTRALTLKDKNGRVYDIRLDGHQHSIETEHEGQRYSLCVIPKTEHGLPTHDVVLAWKIMLDTDPETFLRLARVRCKETGEYIESGGFLIGDKRQTAKVREWQPIDLPEEVLENPREWVETRCRD